MKNIPNNYTFFLYVIGLLLMLSFVSCSRTNKTKELKLAHCLDQNHPVHKGMVFMAESQKKLLFVINLCIALFVLFVLAIGGSWLVFTRFQFKVSSAALQLPLGYVYIVLPISGLLMVYYSIIFMYTKESGYA